MNFLICYLLSGLKKTARNSQNAIKESPPKASQTQKIVFRRGAFASQNPHQGFALDPQGGPLNPSPNLSHPPPQHTKVWIRPWKSRNHSKLFPLYQYKHFTKDNSIKLHYFQLRGRSLKYKNFHIHDQTVIWLTVYPAYYTTKARRCETAESALKKGRNNCSCLRVTALIGWSGPEIKQSGT